MVTTAKLYMLKSVSKLKTNKSLKLLLVESKANSSILLRLGIAWMAQTSINSFVVCQVRVENHVGSIS